jgi:hypothetical protein
VGQKPATPEDIAKRTDSIMAVISAVATIANHAGDHLVQIEKDIIGKAVAIAELHATATSNPLAADTREFTEFLEAILHHALLRLESVVIEASGQLGALAGASIPSSDAVDQTWGS